MGNLDRQALHEALKRQIGTSALSKVISVNYDLTTNDELDKVFKTVADAQTWITANGGTLSASNTWTIKLPSGLITERLVKLAFIEFEVSTGTIIDKLTSGVAYSTSSLSIADLRKAAMQNAQINTLVIPSGMYMILLNCNTTYIEIRDDTSKLFVQSGIHVDLDLGNSECAFDNVLIERAITNYNYTIFTNCLIKEEITVGAGEILRLKDSLCNFVNNGGTIKNPQPTYDSNLTASATTKGCRRYKETANSSSFEMVMKTGATTWEWVKIKENTW